MSIPNPVTAHVDEFTLFEVCQLNVRKQTFVLLLR
jgi:hypothetical protein